MICHGRASPEVSIDNKRCVMAASWSSAEEAGARRARGCAWVITDQLLIELVFNNLSNYRMTGKWMSAAGPAGEDLPSVTMRID
jgi:hypothetical protein